MLPQSYPHKSIIFLSANFKGEKLSVLCCFVKQAVAEAVGEVERKTNCHPNDKPYPVCDAELGY